MACKGCYFTWSFLVSFIDCIIHFQLETYLWELVWLFLALAGCSYCWKFLLHVEKIFWNWPQEILNIPHSESISGLIKVDQNDAVIVHFTIFVSHDVTTMSIVVTNNADFRIFVIISLLKVYIGKISRLSKTQIGLPLFYSPYHMGHM